MSDEKAISVSRIESAQKMAEQYAEANRNEDGVTNREGGMLLMLVGIIEAQKEKLGEVRRYAEDRSIHAGHRNNVVSSWRIASDLNQILDKANKGGVAST